MTNSWLDTILNTGANAYASLNESATAKETRKAEEARARAAAAAASQQKTTPAWLMPVLMIGGGLVVVLGIVFALRK
jgi:hypothetical protein